MVKWAEASCDDNILRSMAKQTDLLGSSAERPSPVSVSLMIVPRKLELPLLVIY